MNRNLPSFEQWMAAVPVPNRAVREERRGPNELLLFVPLRRRWFTSGPLRWLLPLSEERGVSLDGLGAEVWGACDGRRSLRQIAQVLSERHHLTFHEARASVTLFLQQLTERKLIVMVGPNRAEQEPSV
ncbi:MAG: PqqD family protein [Phycisphaeraceae bacterium]|nr:PqqD family protein [Phycisphaeraceae bacterium]